jgi:hypothetical protein
MSGLGGISLLPPLVVTLIALVFGIRACLRSTTALHVTIVAALLLFATSLILPVRLDYDARLWRAAVFGAYSGRDPRREELRREGLAALTPEQRRHALGAWRLYGLRPEPPRPTPQEPPDLSRR